MKPGPRPTPTKLKKLAGNPGRRPLNDAEPQFEVPGRMLNVPDYLDGRGADVWRDLGKLLLDAGLFTVVDKYALGMFCAAAGRWMDAEIEIQASGGPVLTSNNGNLYQNPHLHVANRAWDQMRQMFGEFGLTPAERSRLEVAARENDIPTLAEQLSQLSEASGAD